MANSSLETIRNKVRRLTRTPSTNQLTDDAINEYINTFIAFDMPESLRLFTLKKTFTFYTKPYVDVYSTNSINNDPLENFTTDYITIEPPIYIAGREALYSQSREEFFNLYPQNSSIVRVATGDGGTTVFTGTLQNVPIQRNNVTFSSVNSSNNSVVLKDVPFNQSSGNLVVPNNAAPGILDPTNQINYITGEFTLTFLSAPGAAQPVNAQTFPFSVARPTAVLYYQNQFTLRPFPDGAYPVTIDAYVKPTELIENDDVPELKQWWQYIAYGAAKKVLEDRMNVEKVQMIMPEFKRQEDMALRRTIVQRTNQRTATIFSVPNNLGSRFGYWN